jgi:hypothetical protein
LLCFALLCFALLCFSLHCIALHFIAAAKLVLLSFATSFLLHCQKMLLLETFYIFYRGGRELRVHGTQCTHFIWFDWGGWRELRVHFSFEGLRCPTHNIHLVKQISVEIGDAAIWSFCGCKPTCKIVRMEIYLLLVARPKIQKQ